MTGALASAVLASTQVLAAGNTTTTGETVTFCVLAPLALAGAMGMVLVRNAIHSALFLVLTMGCLGVFYFVEGGPFLGAVQIIVYTGAIMILFLFVLMLVGRDSSDSIVETIRGQRVAAGVLGIAFAALAATAVARGLRHTTVVGLTGDNAPANNVTAIAERLFTKYLLAFELTSALLITAAIGAMVLAHIEREPGAKRTQRDLSRERFRSGRPQPLPGPGVFATSNSIATPALLPDGSSAPESISPLVEPHRPVEPNLLPAAPSTIPPAPADETTETVETTETAGTGEDQPPAEPGSPLVGSPIGAAASAVPAPPRAGAGTTRARRSRNDGSKR